MSIVYPKNRKEVSDRAKTDFQNELPESEPFLRNSYVSALITSLSGRIYDAYLQLQKIQTALFPDTATDEFADRWASYKGIVRESASKSSGYITATGNDGVIVPLGTALQSSDGLQYLTLGSVTLTDHDIAITSITRSAQLATVTTASEHLLASGVTVTISGATQIEYNITTEITVTSATTFTYDVLGSPATPATGTIIANIIFASIQIKSVDFGKNTNLDSGTELTFSSVIAGLNSSAFVQYEGITGGEDIESDFDFRNRYLETYRHPIAYLNVQQLITQAKLVDGVTRVFVDQITPAVGQFTLRFMMDNEINPIPPALIVARVKDEILKIKPASDDPNDYIILAPIPVVVNFVFTSLSPDTDTMRDAITENLKAMFREVPIPSQDLSSFAYTSAIYQTVDPATGDFIDYFTLSSPVGDITITAGQIAILGTITWP